MDERERVSGVFYDRTINGQIKGNVYRTVIHQHWYMGQKHWHCHCECYECAELHAQLDRIRNERIRDNESRRNTKESTGKEVKVVWACDEKRGALCR